ncbi:MAG: hypothetical protein VB046_12380 [Paludibacter sp.]|nr:hypothetical protein [Paludibacter sp.]
MNIKISLIFKFSILLFLITAVHVVYAQSSSPESLSDDKRLQKKNLIIREFNTDAKGKNNWMDHLTVYNENGYKVQEIEYAVYGMRSKVLFEYDENNRCIKEIVYDDRNKITRIRKISYNADGTRKAQYNYLPNGRLFSTKRYEYSIGGGIRPR